MDEYTQEFQSLKNDLYRLNNSVDNLAIAIANQQSFINNMINHINMQVGALNNVTQSIVSLQNKLSDMEISQSSIDDAVKDAVDNTSSLTQELAEIKLTLDSIKFYTQGFVTGTNQF